MIDQRMPLTTVFPPGVVELVEAARSAEETATGSNRRRCYRDTRSILGALRELGYTVHDLADLLGAPVSTTRQRIDAAGLLAEPTVLALSRIRPDELDLLADHRAISPMVMRDPSVRQFAAVDILRLLLAAT